MGIGTEPKAYVRTEVSKDKRHVKIFTHVGEECAWVEFDAEQFDGLLAAFHRTRGEMEP